MASNPGHYVAIIITSEPPASRSTRNAATAPVKHLKLLRPDDTLHIGHLYRLISFEEILRDFVWKHNGRLGRLLVAGKEKNYRSAKDVSGDGAASSANCSSPAMGDDEARNRAGVAPQVLPSLRPRQWKPALQSIAEMVGS
ncbi:hypothetical protein HPP92_007767 [Vanilla planifolia]|nr:hypothetical protein HPP92_007767 [Vanilla planifolia]